MTILPPRSTSAGPRALGLVSSSAYYCSTPCPFIPRRPAVTARLGFIDLGLQQKRARPPRGRAGLLDPPAWTEAPSRVELQGCAGQRNRLLVAVTTTQGTRRAGEDRKSTRLN